MFGNDFSNKHEFGNDFIINMSLKIEFRTQVW